MRPEPISCITQPALGLARIQHFIGFFSPAERADWIAHFVSNGTVSKAEAELLTEHNMLDCL